MQAQAMIQIGNAIRAIQRAMLSLPLGSDVHRATLKAVTDLAKHFPQGEATEGAQQTELQDQQRDMMRQALMRRILQNSGGPPQPQPSTPLPGA